jgi:RimJ/RimL family protein N-acetyltransferase
MRLIGPRVILRRWDNADLPAFAAMNADDRVMEFFPKKLSRKESREVFAVLKDEIEDRGWGLWAVEINGELAGYTGLARPSFEAHFTPCTEIGWRFRPQFWGHAYATEAARLALLFAFSTLHLEEVVSFAARVNLRSVKVMQRLGMAHDSEEDFNHPKLPAGHVLQRHVLYRLKNTPETTATLKRELGIRIGERTDRVG